MPTKIIGTAPYQVPRNSDLGTLAVQDLDNVSIQGGAVSLNASVTQGYFQNTDVSEVKPSLLLDFANGKSLDSRVTFSRASTATYYDGSNTVLAEHNLFPNSQQFATGGVWVKNNVWCHDSAIAPDGTNTATHLVPSTVADYHNLYWDHTPPAGTYTFSVFAKAGAYSFLCLLDTSPTTVRATTFNLGNGTIPTVASGHTASIVNAGNGWYRCSITLAETGSFSRWYINPASANNSPSTACDGVSGIYVWGAQLEQRSGASKYIPTLNTPVMTYVPAIQYASNNQPRFDHDPITGESKGFLIEEAKTNLVTYSVAGSTGWSGAAAVVPNATVAPDGTLTATKLYSVTTSVFQSWYWQGSASGNTTYTRSIYAKAGEMTWIKLMQYDGYNNLGVYFDLANGIVGSAEGTLTGSIIPAGNGWYRCIVTNTTASAGTVERVQVALAAGNNASVIFTGDNYSGVYIWGAQIETGSFASSYIPTSGASATRAADSAVLYSTAWYNQLEGTIYAEHKHPITPFACPVELCDASGYNRILLYTPGAAEEVYITSNSTIWVSTAVSSALFKDSFGKEAIAYKTHDFAGCANGGSVTVDSTVLCPNNIAQLHIGKTRDGFWLNGHLKKIAYYPKRLSNAELQEITL